MITKRDQLEKYEFKNPDQMLRYYPSLFGHDLDTVMKKTESRLAGMGIGGWKQVVQTFPAIVGKDWDRIKEKIETLKKIGFKKIDKILLVQPSIVAMDIEDNLGEKINQLVDWRINNPVDFLEKSISNISRSIGTMKKNYELIKKICDDNVNLVDPSDVIQYTKSILGTQPKRLEIISLIFKRYATNDERINADIHKLIFANIENMVLTYLQTSSDNSLMEFYNTKYLEIKKENVSKEEKQVGLKKICQRKSNFDEDTQKVLFLYERGYLKKKR